MLTTFVREAVSHGSACFAPMNGSGYRELKAEYPARVMVITAGEYVVGAVHTNTIEGFWSIVKRGIVGTSTRLALNICRCTSPNSSSAITTVRTRTFR